MLEISLSPCAESWKKTTSNTDRIYVNSWGVELTFLTGTFSSHLNCLIKNPATIFFMRFSKILLLIIGMTISCNYPNKRIYLYPHNSKNSKPNGEPTDSMAQFFAREMKFNDTVVQA